jgi:hypothetical protein
LRRQFTPWPGDQGKIPKKVALAVKKLNAKAGKKEEKSGHRAEAPVKKVLQHNFFR